MGRPPSLGALRTRQNAPSPRPHLRRDPRPDPRPEGNPLPLCREIRPSDAAVDAIRSRTGPGSRLGVPVDTQRRRRHEVAQLRANTRGFARRHLDDAFFIAGVALYWGEGSKAHAELSLSNSDPRALRLFVAWVRSFLAPDADFVLRINLHAENDEPGARAFWREATGLGDAACHRTFVKPEGTGHRKNHLPFAVCQARVRKCTDSRIQTVEWVDTVATAGWELLPPRR